LSAAAETRETTRATAAGREAMGERIGVSRDSLITTLRSVGSFDELAVLEYRAGTDQRDEVR
jgi:hypothetical protein